MCIINNRIKCEIIDRLIKEILKNEPDLKIESKEALDNINIFVKRIYHSLRKSELLNKSQIENALKNSIRLKK